VYDKVILSILIGKSSSIIKVNGMSLEPLGSNACRVKQKHSVLLKYLAAENGDTLGVACATTMLLDKFSAK
jgi:hypothetical protein